MVELGRQTGETRAVLSRLGMQGYLTKYAGLVSLLYVSPGYSFWRGELMNLAAS